MIIDFIKFGSWAIVVSNLVMALARRRPGFE